MSDSGWAFALPFFIDFGMSPRIRTQLSLFIEWDLIWLYHQYSQYPLKLDSIDQNSTRQIDMEVKFFYWKETVEISFPFG